MFLLLEILHRQLQVRKSVWRLCCSGGPVCVSETYRAVPLSTWRRPVVAWPLWALCCRQRPRLTLTHTSQTTRATRHCTGPVTTVLEQDVDLMCVCVCVRRDYNTPPPRLPVSPGYDACVEVLLDQEVFRKIKGNSFSPLHCAV